MRFAPEGTPFIAASAVVGVLLAVVLVRLLSAPAALGLMVGIAPMAFTGYFFRDPRRTVDLPDSVVLSPADGRVTDIVEVDEPTLGGLSRRIGIFLSVFNVHVQRAPTTGTVVRREHRPGAFKAAWSTDIGTQNEHAILEMKTEAGTVMIRQIAGLIARRIITDPAVGETLVRGDRIGLIRFGSRVELTVPMDWEVTCKPGDRVSASETPLAVRPASEATQPEVSI